MIFFAATVDAREIVSDIISSSIDDCRKPCVEERVKEVSSTILSDSIQCVDIESIEAITREYILSAVPSIQVTDVRATPLVAVMKPDLNRSSTKTQLPNEEAKPADCANWRKLCSGSTQPREVHADEIERSN